MPAAELDAGSMRTPCDVVTASWAGPCMPVPARTSETMCCATLHCTRNLPPANVATEPAVVLVRLQLPGVIGASRQPASTATGVGEAVTAGAGLWVGAGAGGRAQAESAIAVVKTTIAVRDRLHGFAFIRLVWNEAASYSSALVPMSDPSTVSSDPRRRPAAKARVDQMLVDRGLAESRSRAQALVLAGLVFSGETKIAKPGQSLRGDAPLEVRGRDHPWVSRGGIKLAHAIEHFGLDPSGAIAMDIGSSTGGFTDVLLTNGAARVFAVDSGTNQLAWKLRQDPRVTVLEQTSARVLTPDMIDAPCDWVVCDASFIGLAKVLEVPLRLAAPECRLVALIKPQFEVGRAEVGKGGVVRDPVLHARVCAEVRAWLEGLGWTVEGIVESPITGPEGNVEFLISARRQG